MKKLIIFLSICVSLIIIFSCVRHQEQDKPNSFSPRTVNAAGCIFPKDSMAEPRVIFVEDLVLKKKNAGNPKIVLTNTNIVPAGQPDIFKALEPVINTPGTANFSMPKTVNAVEETIETGIPEVVIAKDAYVKDLNPQSFSSFGKLQGLKHNSVRGILEDNKGNLWFATGGGGVCKYDGRQFTHYTDKEGLAGNDVLCLLEDRKGNLWFGTNGGGVSRFDGRYFTNFRVKEGLPNNIIYGIMEDSKGNIWLATYGGGACKYDGSQFTVFTEKEGLSSNIVLCMLENKKGDLFFGTSLGVSIYDGGKFTVFTDKEGLSHNNIMSLLEDSKGNIWLGTWDGGVCKYDGTHFSHFTTTQGLPNNNVYSMLEDKNGDLWFGSYEGGGLCRFDGSQFINFSEKDGMTNNNVLCITEDKCGNMWFGTLGGGVCKFDGSRFTHFTGEEGLSNVVVFGILEDRSGELWFGSYGGGACRYDGKSFNFFTDMNGLLNNSINCVTEDNNGSIWFGTSDGPCMFNGKEFINYFEKDGLFKNHILSILADTEGNIWFGTFGVGVLKYDGQKFVQYTERQGLSNNSVFSIEEDKEGNIWFGTNGGGACKFDGEQFTKYSEKEGLSSNFVSSINQDKNGILWFGTHGGITRYDGKKFTHFTTREGLSNNIVFSILDDSKGNMWFGTRYGLNLFSNSKLKELSEKERSGRNYEIDAVFKNYSYEDGFLGIGCNRNAIFEQKDGTIWVGSNDRLTAYHPSIDSLNSVSVSPVISLTGIQLFNEDINWSDLQSKKDSILVLGNGVKIIDCRFNGINSWDLLPQNLNLAYNNNFLTFNYIGTTMSQPKKVKYRYKLEGIDDYWSALTLRTEAQYGNLPHGNYTFKVKAMNSDGLWSNELNYTFTIRPPWWKTFWFKTLVILSILSGMIFYIKWRERALKERQKILEKTVQERTEELVQKNIIVEKQKAEVEKQKERSEELLLNILPAEVAEELKIKGTADARHYTEVTVMFTDFKGFTQIAEKLSPADLVNEIHTCFKAFDNIISKYGIEKIKTIGDSYMCAGGLPVENVTNAADIVKAALEIRQFMREHIEQARKNGKEIFEIRIGVHTGQVVAGIVGIKKFAYDIWGDAVNTASRMESSGEAGKVNISGATYEIVKDRFECTYRGKVQAKHKGEIDMYFVERMK